MAPFFVLIALFGTLTILGRLEVPAAFGWWTSLRLALSGMFLLTASAHWGKRRPDLVRMVPPNFARPELAVTLTGFLEIAGAFGLMVAELARYAAVGLCLLLLAVFPANVHAARQRFTIGGTRVPGLIPRALMQLVFIAATAAIFLDGTARTR